tara:strand:- start:2812 stop:3396 length:585 start_codon:yes stop_codon:yes gene_type:complete
MTKKNLPCACEGQTIEGQFLVNENCPNPYVIRVVSGLVAMRETADVVDDNGNDLFVMIKTNDVISTDKPMGLYGWELYDKNGYQVRTMLAEQKTNFDGTRMHTPDDTEEVPFNTIDDTKEDALDYLQFLIEFHNEQHSFYNRLSGWGEDDEWVWSSFDQADVVWAEKIRENYDHDFTDDIDLEDIRHDRELANG